MNMDTAQAGGAGTRMGFTFLVIYVLSQAFLIPVAAIGPSWSLWPCLSDLALAGLVLSVLLGSRNAQAISRQAQALLVSLVLLYGFCWLSYLFAVGSAPDSVPLLDGAYYVFRLTQFLLLYWCVIQIPLSPRRLAILGAAAGTAFFIVSGSIYLTYFKLLPLGMLTRHLPQAPEVAGSWAAYGYLDRFPDIPAGFGTIGYNHSYGAVQVLLLLAMCLHLNGARHTLASAAYLLIALGAIFLTDSRAGFAAALLFAAVYALRNPKVLVGAFCLALAAVPYMDTRQIEKSVRRQQGIAQIEEGGALNDREVLWTGRMERLRQDPWAILIGSGLGSARARRGSTAHMLYLQILTEMGALGLLLFAMLAGTVLYTLRRHDTADQPVLWATIALLLSAAAQETFYPVPALGHFTGLYLLVVAIVLRRRACTNRVLMGS